MSDELFSLFVIDGDPVDWANDPTCPYLKFTELTWEKAVDLCRLSFDEGYTAIIWRLDDTEVETGGTNDAETESGKEL